MKTSKGFKQEAPKEVIRRVCKQYKEYLGPDVIDAFVQSQRKAWEEELLRRTYTVKPNAKEPWIGNPFYLAPPTYEIFEEGSAVGDSTPIASFNIGSWEVNLMLNPFGHPEFSYNVWTEARRAVTALAGEKCYERWRRFVLIQHKQLAPTLADMLKKFMPNRVFFSVTTGESSERLMSRTPLVHMHRKVAFLIIP
jgi:hypothetical protein